MLYLVSGRLSVRLWIGVSARSDDVVAHAWCCERTVSYWRAAGDMQHAGACALLAVAYRTGFAAMVTRVANAVP